MCSFPEYKSPPVDFSLEQEKNRKIKVEIIKNFFDFVIKNIYTRVLT